VQQLGRTPAPANCEPLTDKLDYPEFKQSALETQH
jgi:hypothetical protein